MTHRLKKWGASLPTTRTGRVGANGSRRAEHIGRSSYESEKEECIAWPDHKNDLPRTKCRKQSEGSEIVIKSEGSVREVKREEISNPLKIEDVDESNLIDKIPKREATVSKVEDKACKLIEDVVKYSSEDAQTRFTTAAIENPSAIIKRRYSDVTTESLSISDIDKSELCYLKDEESPTYTRKRLKSETFTEDWIETQHADAGICAIKDEKLGDTDAVMLLGCNLNYKQNCMDSDEDNISVSNISDIMRQFDLGKDVQSGDQGGVRDAAMTCPERVKKEVVVIEDHVQLPISPALYEERVTKRASIDHAERRSDFENFHDDSLQPRDGG